MKIDDNQAKIEEEILEKKKKSSWEEAKRGEFEFVYEKQRNDNCFQVCFKKFTSPLTRLTLRKCTLSILRKKQVLLRTVVREKLDTPTHPILNLFLMCGKLLLFNCRKCTLT